MDWTVLIPRLVHPTKVLIIEAMLWIDRAMSASELVKVFDETVNISSLSYHVRILAQEGVLERIRERKIRGATERFYYFVGASG